MMKPYTRESPSAEYYSAQYWDSAWHSWRPCGGSAVKERAEFSALYYYERGTEKVRVIDTHGNVVFKLPEER